jgi:hypothetical protein
MQQTTPYDVLRNDPKSQPAVNEVGRSASRSSRCTIALFLCVLSLVAVPGFGGDLEAIDGTALNQPRGEAIAADLEEAPSIPRISGALYPKVNNKLQQAYPVAVEHLRDNPECRDLFAALGADGLEKLSITSYRQSNLMMERSLCEGGVSAITVVECPQVRLCKRFARLGTVQAAATLIHEALHFAGMSEKPLDPQGLEPRQIDRMVKEACGF